MPRSLTEKQRKAIKGIREGKSPTVAMREAGYAESTIDSPNHNLLGTPGVRTYMEDVKSAHIKIGTTPEYMAQKSQEWLEAKSGKRPDYRTQTRAGEMVRKDFGWGDNQVTSLTQINYYFDKSAAKKFEEALEIQLDE